MVVRICRTPYCGLRLDTIDPHDRCKYCRERQPKVLYHEEERVLDVLRPYYELLTKHDAFRAQLQQSFDTLRPLLTDTDDGELVIGPLVLEKVDDINVDHLDTLPAQESWRLDISPEAEAAIIEALLDFVARWHLPHSYGMNDLLRSFQAHACEDAPLGLYPGIRRVRSHIGGVIQPSVALPFVFNPAYHSVGWVHQRAKQMANEIAKSVMTQVGVLNQQAQEVGWKRRSPRRLSQQQKENPEVIALRLYRHVILRLRDHEIAALEESELTEGWCDPVTVKASNKHWARKLHIPLPSRPTGRPRKVG